MQTIAYKGFTHDLRSPIQGGAPVWDGTLPHTLPHAAVDSRTTEECGAGWNAALGYHALRITGLWPDGWPSRIFEVHADAPVIVAGDKLRAATWTITRELSQAEIGAQIGEISAVFGEHADAMVVEQILWRGALARQARGLSWTTRRFDSVGSARDAWSAWSARSSWSARSAWSARGAWDTWAARDAWAALFVQFAARCGWVTHAPDMLTVGLRDAYRTGLAIALPTGPDELGWAMVAP